MCSHALKAQALRNVVKILSQRILKRWTKKVKEEITKVVRQIMSEIDHKEMMSFAIRIYFNYVSNWPQKLQSLNQLIKLLKNAF